MLDLNLSISVIMVARSSSIARAKLPLYFAERFFFFSRNTFSDVAKPTSTKISHTTWLSLQQNLGYTDFFKVPLKTYGGRKTQNLHHFSCQVADIYSAIIL